MGDDIAGSSVASCDPAIRSALVEIAARVLGEMPAARVPPSLKPIARFAPKRRASAGAGPLWAALIDDRAFRADVAAVHATAIRALPDDEDPIGRGVSAFLHRADGWEEQLATASLELVSSRENRATASGMDDAALVRARKELERERAARKSVEGELSDARAELTLLRKDLRKLRSDADRARAEGRAAKEEAESELARARALAAEAESIAAAARATAARSEREIAAERATTRQLREVLDVRTLLLLDTLAESASALRRELALGASLLRPADLVVPEDEAVSESGLRARQGSRGRASDDPGWLGELLSLPQGHVVVDGYNVTKTAHPEWTLSRQRTWLSESLSRLAVRHGVEVTCVFDGVTQVDPSPSPLRTSTAARGVRVRFSRDEIADNVVRRIVEAEPAGRVVVVVSSDAEVARDVQAMGAYAVDSSALIGFLARL